MIEQVFFGVTKAESGNNGFSIDGFYVRGSTVYRTDPPPKLLDMFTKFNATHASAKCTGHTKKSDSLFQI